jgi:hypothetical protein
MAWIRLGGNDDRGDQQGTESEVAVIDGEEVVVMDISDLVKDVPEPEPGPVTPEVVETLRKDPELAEVAEIAESYSS